MSHSASDAELSETESEPSEELEDAPQDSSDPRSKPHREAHNVRDELRNISFGALVDAQDAVGEKQRLDRSQDTPPSSAEKLQAIRDRLAELRDAKEAGGARRGSKTSTRQSSGPGSSAHRASKHAPTELSSKRPVSRKRAAVEVLKNPTHARDPRFAAVSGRVDEEKIRRNYAFLDDYRQKELGELKAAMKKSKNADEKERLKKETMAMENRQRQTAEEERQRKVLQEHRKKEKELVREGKQPFYLKRSELKRQALVAKFEGMKGKERAQTMERRRKKASQREKRSMPGQRRRPDDD